MKMKLTVGYGNILRASDEARGEDFTVKKRLVRKLHSNPLWPFFNSLSDFLVTHSAEAIELVQSKVRSRSASPQKKAKISNQKTDDGHILMEAMHRIPPSSILDPSDNSPSTPTGTKRVFSGESYGHSSTETTPSKIKHSEPLTQALQNSLIGTLIWQLWLGGAEISWAQNREMYLDYRPYTSRMFHINNRTFNSSFRCRLEGNNGAADDRIIAIPDGALILVTNKKSDPESKLIWSLQAAALAFEVY
jgi:hypothetical protein